MKVLTNQTLNAFFSLVRAGLWEKEIHLSFFGDIDYKELYRLAEEQAVEGLVAAGIEHVTDVKIPKEVSLSFVGVALQLEQRNSQMNEFLGRLNGKIRDAGIYALVVKGQGVAQCYERPLWRACGDIDFLLGESNYENAKQLLLPLASSVEKEGKQGQHLGMTIDSWVVELHGGLRYGLSTRMDQEIEEILKEVFCGRDIRSWMNGQEQIILPGEDSDVVFVFTHFIKHFYKEGLGVRQICDWCRLLWTYRESVNYELLESRIKEMGLISEWRAFGALAIEYLGFPKDAMPLLDVRSKKEDVRWRKKADRIMEFILKSGNMGHNRDMSHFSKYPYLIRKCVSMGRRIGDLINHARIFPLDSLRFFPRIMFNGVRSAMRGE